MGQAIKRRRLELGLTQEQLCEGICEPITISRLENGKQTPSRTRINAILGRLDMPADRYYALLSKNELDIEALNKKIVACNLEFNRTPQNERKQVREKGLQLLKELESIIEKDDTLIRQEIIRSRVILGREDGPYSAAEQRNMLMTALQLTSPTFDIDEINKGLYTTDEIKIINQLALVHIYADEHIEAIEVLGQLYKYIKKHFRNMSPIKSHLSVVTTNYANELYAVGQYKKAVETATEGQQICLSYGCYQCLPELLGIMAECNHFLGNDEESLDLFYQSYYLLKAFRNYNNLEKLKKDAKDLLNIELEDRIRQESDLGLQQKHKIH